jgi:hypothetical protein
VLLREDGEDVIVIGQASHAWVSGQLARAWGNEAFPPPAPREEVCLAATQHDVGMMEWDRRPALDPRTRLPHSFMEMPLDVHLALWSAAPHKVLSQSTYAALLVSMHGTALYARRDLDQLEPERARQIRCYLADQRALQARLAARLNTDPEQVRRNQRLIWTWDSMSLAICLGWERTPLRDVPAATDTAADTAAQADLELTQSGPDAFCLHPWPFRERAVSVHCEGRRLAGRFDSDQELHEALDNAPLRRLTFTLSG